MRESTIEAHLVRRIKALGGTAEKFTSTTRGVPDRLISLPNGKIVFVEVKAPGKKATENQQRDHDRRRALGFTVLVLDSKEAINDAFPL